MKHRQRITFGRLFGWAFACTVAVAGGAIAIAAYFARRVLTPAKRAETGVRVVDIERENDLTNGSIVWIAGVDAELQGAYSFIWNEGAGHARLGPVLRTERRRGKVCVARQILRVDSGQLRVGTRGRVTGWWFSGPEGLGLPWERVEIPAPMGHIWGWVITPDAEAPDTGHWAIHVHGRGALPRESLRGVAPFARAGVGSLVLAYRNDPGASPGLRGRFGLGLAEWRDVDAALSWLRERGATSVTLVGWSMGATTVVLAAGRSKHRPLVNGIVLDSPALDWPAILALQARLVHLPRPLARLSAAILQRGWVRGAIPGERGTNLHLLTTYALAEHIQVPTLIHVGEEDTFVSWEAALRLASLKPELVILRETEGEHVKHWNADPQAWEQSTERFVRALRS